MDTLYVSDLDGTLLDADASLSAPTRAILGALLDEGLCFTVATARSIHSIRSVLGDLPLRLPVIESNGAYVTDYASGRHLTVQAFPPAVARGLHAAILAQGHSPFVSAFDGAADRLGFDRVANGGMEWYLEDRRRAGDPRLDGPASGAAAVAHAVVSFTVIGERGPLEELAALLARDYGGELELHCVPHLYSRWHWLSLHPGRGGKGRGIRALQRARGLEGREVVVFGDHDNDLGMFQMADRAVAVANATDELKRISHAVIGANTEDAVARFLREEAAQRPPNSRR